MSQPRSGSFIAESERPFEPNKPAPFRTDTRNIHPVEVPDEDRILEGADRALNKLAKAIHVKELFHWARPKTFHERAVFSFETPHSYQLPGKYYEGSNKSSTGHHRHLDVFHRPFEGWKDDRFLDPLDGRIRVLHVQATNQLYDTPNDTSWRRTYIRNISPMLIRLAWWPYAAVPSGMTTYMKGNNPISRFQSRTASWNSDHWVHVGLRWLPACIGMLCVMCIPGSVQGHVRNNGLYDPVPYRFWSYPKSARNKWEDRGAKSSAYADVTISKPPSHRILRPRYLCFLDSRSPENPHGLLDPATWQSQQRDRGAQPTYIFISYTAQGQFERPCKVAQDQLDAGQQHSCTCEQCIRSRSDAEALHEIARAAAAKAKVAAYWTDKSCFSQDKDERSQDIHQICDVVRGATKLVIVVGRAGCDQLPSGVTTRDLLIEWGKRMWTWPEIILAPSGKKVAVYTRGVDEPNWEISRLNLADRAWEDGSIARDIIDHYEGSITLSRLELVVMALDALKRRVVQGTNLWRDGDLSYALMGLLRQRPDVDRNDSAFQAFARLSLANDSDRLLERMICLLPAPLPAPSSESEDGLAMPKLEGNAEKHYWADMSDHWGVKLWDIEPHCQVAGIAENDTVILDGAKGATIHWDSFQLVAVTTRETLSRALGRWAVRAVPAYFFTGLLMISFSSGNPPLKAFGALILVAAIIFLLLLPMLILHIYSGKVWNSQPWLFGFEGYMKIRDIERKIFGFPCERLSWAPYSSEMSCHALNNEFLDDECEGTDPLLGGRAPVPPQARLETEGKRLFTLVDTNTMTVSLFHAPRPPAVALVCGSEGGMQRAVLCSYDWTTQTLYRESVLRMETIILGRMSRIGRVRFGLRRVEP